MTDEKLQGFLDKINEEALPFVPLLNCYVCLQPIEDRAVVVELEGDIHVMHLECDDSGDENFYSGTVVGRVP